MEEEERHCRRHRARMHHTFATVCLLVLSVITCSECQSYQAPRFITQPTSTKNVIGEGQTKIIQCQALENLQSVPRDERSQPDGQQNECLLFC